MKKIKLSFWHILAIFSLVLCIPCVFYPGAKFGALFFGTLCVGSFIMIYLTKKSKTNDKNSTLMSILAQTGRFLFILWLISFIITEGLIVSSIKSSNIPDDTDYLIVLGAKINNNHPSATLYERLKLAQHHLESNPELIVVVCGGQGADEITSEAEVMKNTLISLGIAEDRIITEPKSNNTVENVQNAKILLDEISNNNYKTAIITSNFHLFRAKIIMQNNGLDAFGAGSKTTYYLVDFVGFIREYFSLIKLFVMGNL